MINPRSPLASLLVATTLVVSLNLQAQQTQTAPKPAKPPEQPMDFSHMGPQRDGDFRKVVLVADEEINGERKDTLKDPMELAVATDGRVFFAQRDGTLKVYDPQTKSDKIVGKLNVFTGLEDGLLGITLDPKFTKNGWIYLYYAVPETTTDANGQKAGENRLARFTLKGDTLDLASEKVMVRVHTQREQCCHSGGSVTFDAKGNLYFSAGDNTNPFHDKTQPKDRNGFGPMDERPGRSPWDAQKSSANSNDLRGKVMRIHPEPDGTYTIPKGNLFPPGTPLTRPEIYAMGCRNPFRISVDQKNGYLYWGDVGPDASVPDERFGPAGFDEVNQARQPGYFGWPYFVADNKSYRAYDYNGTNSGALFDPTQPVNNSPNNTGLKNLPPAQPAFIYYPPSLSSRFPVINGAGGRTAMAGPVYYFDPKLKSEHKLPQEFDHTLFIYEWSRNWIIAVHLDKNDKIAKMERFCSKMTFKRPIDMELGADGCLYVIEWGTAWGNNLDTQIIRLEYAPDGAPKQTSALTK